MSSEEKLKILKKLKEQRHHKYHRIWNLFDKKIFNQALINQIKSTIENTGFEYEMLNILLRKCCWKIKEPFNQFVRTIVKSGASINECSGQHSPLSSILTTSEDLRIGTSMLIYFLEKGAKHNPKQSEDPTLFLRVKTLSELAVINSDPEIAIKFLDIIAKYYPGDVFKSNPLFEIISMKTLGRTHADVVQKLVAMKIEVNQKDGSGCTPILLACHQTRFGEYLPVIRKLVELGDDLNIPTRTGVTGLMSVMLFITDPSIKTDEKFTQNWFDVVRFIVNNMTDIRGVDVEGRNVLHFMMNAHEYIDIDILRYLLGCGVDYLAKNNNGDDPLAVLAKNNKHSLTKKQQIRSVILKMPRCIENTQI
jgi:hypothetical protein